MEKSKKSGIVVLVAAIVAIVGLLCWKKHCDKEYL